MAMKVVDLFSGSGGMSSGFVQTGGHFRIVGAVDKETAKPGSKNYSTNCNATYEHNIGVRPMGADLSVLKPSALRRDLGLEVGELGVLISCAPCTGFSQQNANNHISDDPRNGLVERTALFVKEFRPEFLAMENVKELIRGNQSHHFANLVSALRRMGYSVWSDVRDLTTFGLPQRRVRALILASRDRPVVGLPPFSSPLRTVRDTIGKLPALENGGQDASDPMHMSPSNSDTVLRRIRAIPKDGGSWGDVMNARGLSLKEKRALLIPKMFRARSGSFPDVYGRLWWDRPAVTITRECGHVGNGRYTHPEQDRLLSIREMALLQGFPPDYNFLGRVSARYNQIGDAVPPLVAKVMAEHIVAMKLGLVGADTDTPIQSVRSGARK